jgi:multidrug efflux pump subunit AcrA (membrane-fusion protein)
MHVRIWIAGLGLAAVGVFTADARIHAADPQQPPPEGAIVLKVCPIKAVQSARLATDRPGVIAVVQPKEGDTVQDGEEIVRLMDEVPQANWEVAKLVADDRIEVEYATKLNAVDALEYIKSVEANYKAPGTISEIELRRLKLAEERSALQIDKAKHDMAVNVMKAKQAKTELDTYHIMAPFKGVVSQVLKHRGEAVKQGDTILEMVNTDVVHVEGKVTDRDIWRVKRGSPVTVVLDIKGADLEIEKQVFHGKIGFVDPVANDTETRVWAEVDNPGNVLRPGFWATMTILPGAVKEGNAGQGALEIERSGPKVVVRREAPTP